MITTNLANALLKYLFGQTKTVDYTDYTSSTDYAKCYIGLSTTTPKADGSNFTEPNPDSTGYSRQQICIGKSADTITWTNFMTIPGETTDKAGKIINGIISNTKEITFNESKSESPYTVTYFGIFHDGSKPAVIAANKRSFVPSFSDSNDFIKFLMYSLFVTPSAGQVFFTTGSL